MAASHRQEDTLFALQTKENRNKTKTPPFDSSSSTQRFQKIAQKIISRSSASTVDHHHNIASNLPSSIATSKHRHMSHAPPVACARCDDDHRRFSHHGASTTDCLAANSGVTQKNLSQSRTPDHKLRQIAQASHLTSVREIGDHAASSSDHGSLVSNNGSSSQLTPSSIKVSRRSSPHQKANSPYVSPIANATCFISNVVQDKPSASNNPSVLRIADATCFVVSSLVQDKSASGTLKHTSSKMKESSFAVPKDVESVVSWKHTKGGSAIKQDLGADNHKRENELCKNCKTSIMESVCYINNDGRTSAAFMSGVSARSLHHCRRPGCAANRGCNYPSASPSSKKTPKKQVPSFLPKKQVPLVPTKITSHSGADLGDPLRVCSSTLSVQGGHNYNSKHEDLSSINETQMTAARSSLEGDDESLTMSAVSHHQVDVHSSSCKEEGNDVLDSFPHIEDHPCLLAQEEEGSQQSYGEHGIFHAGNGTPAASSISSDITHDHNNDNDHDMGSISKDAIDELHDFKSFCYHGDNEYSCSEDGTDATTTPNSLIKGAFDSLSILDHTEEHSEDKASEMKRPSMARMRRKYLESLREQEAEMVRLRKQEIMARKQAEDWMLDCHMEELLHKLAPNGEARVKVLVEAFETVIHHSDSESSQTHQQEQNHVQEEREQRENMHSTDSSS